MIKPPGQSGSQSCCLHCCTAIFLGLFLGKEERSAGLIGITSSRSVESTQPLCMRARVCVSYWLTVEKVILVGGGGGNERNFAAFPLFGRSNPKEMSGFAAEVRCGQEKSKSCSQSCSFVIVELVASRATLSTAALLPRSLSPLFVGNQRML